MKYFSFFLLLFLFANHMYGQCDYTRCDYNDYLEQEVKILNSQLLFQNNLNSDLQSTVMGNGVLQNIDGYKSIWLSITVAAEREEDVLGKLYNGSIVTFSLENNEELKFLISHSKKMANNNTSTYSFALSLENERIEALRKHKIRNIEIPWSKGGSSYTVNKSDFFISSLPCLL